MSGRALILTYHAIEKGPAPLCLEPDLFRVHLDCLADVGAATLTISELSAAIRAAELPPRAVAITFDDGCASAVEVAAAMLAEHGRRATFFCVAGYLGRTNEWRTQPARVPRLALAGARELADVAAAGFEVGAHGFEHAPLDRADSALARHELEGAKDVIERAVGAPVRSVAYPYGLLPSAEARAQVEALYGAACVGGTARVRPGADLFALPRVDVHYLRRPALLRRAVAGRIDGYLGARRLGARARRAFRKDSR